MTTIALDKTHIAWESRITLGSEIADYHGQKVWLVGRKVIGFAGDYGLLDPVVEWYQKGARAKAAKENLIGEWQLLVVDPKGAFVYSDDVPHKSPIIAPYAFGTGGAYARGALLAGATAYQAVQIACKCDAFSGGEINSLSLEDAFKGKA